MDPCDDIDSIITLINKWNLMHLYDNFKGKVSFLKIILLP